MTHLLRVGPWHIGPFLTHSAAQHWAEVHGVDDYDLVELDDPAEAPGRLSKMWQAARSGVR